MIISKASDYTLERTYSIMCCLLLAKQAFLFLALDTHKQKEGTKKESGHGLPIPAPPTTTLIIKAR